MRKGVVSMLVWVVLMIAGVCLLKIFKKVGSIILCLAISGFILYIAYKISMETMHNIHYVIPFQTIFS